MIQGRRNREIYMSWLSLVHILILYKNHWHNRQIKIAKEYRLSKKNSTIEEMYQVMMKIQNHNYQTMNHHQVLEDTSNKTINKTFP